jgi:small-conductance mechanosensitive channel
MLRLAVGSRRLVRLERGAGASARRALRTGCAGDAPGGGAPGQRSSPSSPGESSPQLAPSLAGGAKLGWLSRAWFKALRRVVDDVDARAFCARGLSFFMYGATVVSALGTAGVDTTPFLAVLGSAGVGTSFALKDVISSWGMGTLLLLHKPFQSGDEVEVLGKIRGQVISVDARYVYLASRDDKGEPVTVIVPSSILLSQPVTVLRRAV